MCFERSMVGDERVWRGTGGRKGKKVQLVGERSIDGRQEPQNTSVCTVTSKRTLQRKPPIESATWLNCSNICPLSRACCPSGLSLYVCLPHMWNSPLTRIGLRCLRRQQSAGLLLLRVHLEALHQWRRAGRAFVRSSLRHLDLPFCSGAHDRCLQHHLASRVRSRYLDIWHRVGTLCGRACFRQRLSTRTVPEPVDRGIFLVGLDVDPAGGLPGCLNRSNKDDITGYLVLMYDEPLIM